MLAPWCSFASRAGAFTTGRLSCAMAVQQLREAHNERIERQSRNHNRRRVRHRSSVSNPVRGRRRKALVIGDKSDAVHETAKLIGEGVTALQIDAGVEADVAKLVRRHFQPMAVSTSLANAGIIGDMGGIFDIDPAAWAGTLRVNLIGPALMVKHAGKAMVDQGRGGAIVLTASVARA